MASVRSLSSRWVAVAFAAAYLVVSLVVGAVLLAMPKTDPAGRHPAYISDDTLPAPSTSQPPVGFSWARGPESLETVIPFGWRVVDAGAPGAMRAVDPSDASRVVGYGGAAAASTDIVAVHVAYEEKFADRTADYRRLDLNSATYGGHPAVEWEFEHQDGGGVQRVHALYWLVGDVEYFLFVSGPEEQWARMRPIYDEMVAHSRP